MSRDIINKALGFAKTRDYVWNLYFIRIDRRTINTYESYKIKFKKNTYLLNYSKRLVETIMKYSLPTIESVNNYDGYNTKVSCDKISIENVVLKDQYDLLISSLVHSNDERLKKKYNGYILIGQSQIDDEFNNIMFIKMANPIIKLDTKKSVVFKNSEDDELDVITDDILRLYLTVDSIVINKTMYCFNHSFEQLFNLEKTLHKVKEQAINTIISTNIASVNEEFEAYLKQITNSRMFISLNSDRISLIKKLDSREIISDITGVELGESKKFNIKSKEDAENICKYLCMKVIKEADTNAIYEAGSVKILRIGS